MPAQDPSPGRRPSPVVGHRPRSARDRLGAPDADPAWDPDRPSSARVGDFLLGGAVNGAVDRELGREMIRHDPTIVAMMRESRSFLRRAVTFLARSGVDQFLDLGSGMATMGNVHEVARRVHPGARVAYVDLDPVAVGHGDALLAGQDGLSFTAADLRDPETVLGAPGVRGALDLARPVALCLFGVLHHVPDADDPATIVRRYLEALTPGSAVALSHATADDRRIDVPGLRRITAAYVLGAVVPRSEAEIAAMLTGVDLVKPGLVPAGRWRPDGGADGDDRTHVHHAGVGFLA